MNTKRYVLASLLVFAFVFIYDSVFHGKLLTNMYMATASLWRPQNECVWSALFLGQFLFAFVFAFLFTKGYENKGLAEGIRYGLLIGLLFVPSHLISYAVEPLPFDLVIAWIIGGVVETILAGMIVAGVYRK